MKPKVITRPLTVTVLGQEIKVIFAPLGALVFEDGDDESVGRYRGGQAEIYVRTDMALNQTRDTLLHEVLHACTNMVNLIPGDEDERIVNALAPILLDALRKSPELVAYLMEGA